MSPAILSTDIGVVPDGTRWRICLALDTSDQWQGEGQYPSLWGQRVRPIAIQVWRDTACFSGLTDLVPAVNRFKRATRLSASSHDTPCLLRDVTKWYENIFPFVLLLFGILFLVRASHSPMIWLSLRGTSIHICGFSEITSILPFKALNLEWLVPYFERNYRRIVVVVLRH